MLKPKSILFCKFLNQRYDTAEAEKMTEIALFDIRKQKAPRTDFRGLQIYYVKSIPTYSLCLSLKLGEGFKHELHNNVRKM
jgi:hypothetical protein